MRVIDRHHDILVTDLVNDNAEEFLVHIGANETLALKILAWQGGEFYHFAAAILLPLVIKTVQPPGQPAAIALQKGHPQIGEALEHPAHGHSAHR